MRSFTAIASFATLAFSAVTSALPASAGFPDITNFDPQSLLNILNGLDTGALSSGQPIKHHDAGYGSPIDAEPPKGIPDVLVPLNDQVIPMCKDLAVKVIAEVDTEAALRLALDGFTQMKDLLEGALDEIKEVAASDTSSVFCLGGNDLEPEVVAQILADLVLAVVSVLGVVVKACASADMKDLLATAVDMSGCLGDIIGLVIKANGGIPALFVPLIEDVVSVVLGLDLTAIIRVTGI